MRERHILLSVAARRLDVLFLLLWLGVRLRPVVPVLSWEHSSNPILLSACPPRHRRYTTPPWEARLPLPYEIPLRFEIFHKHLPRSGSKTLYCGTGLLYPFSNYPMSILTHFPIKIRLTIRLFSVKFLSGKNVVENDESGAYDFTGALIRFLPP